MQLAGLLTILQVTDVMVSLGNLVERTCVKKIEKNVHVKSDIGVIWKMKYWTERN
jgi:hypothetical protein